MIESNSRCTWRWRLSELRDTLRGRDWASFTPCRSVHLRYPCTSVHPRSLNNNLLGGRDRASWELHLVAEIEWTQGCTWRWWWSECGDALGGRDRASLEMHFEALIEWVWRCTWILRSTELRDALGGHDRASLEMHFEAVIDQAWRCTWRPWSSEIGGVLGGGHSGGSRSGGRRDGSWDSIHWLVNSKQWECDDVTLPLKLWWRTGWLQSICREVRQKLKLYSAVNSKSREWRDNRQS